jgi:hypothetical protein
MMFQEAFEDWEAATKNIHHFMQLHHQSSHGYNRILRTASFAGNPVAAMRQVASNVQHHRPLPIRG